MRSTLILTGAVLMTLSCASTERTTTTADTTPAPPPTSETIGTASGFGTTGRTDLSGYGASNTVLPGPETPPQPRLDVNRDGSLGTSSGAAATEPRPVTKTKKVKKGSTGDSSSYRKAEPPTEPPYRSNSDFTTTDRP